MQAGRLPVCRTSSTATTISPTSLAIRTARYTRRAISAVRKRRQSSSDCSKRTSATGNLTADNGFSNQRPVAQQGSFHDGKASASSRAAMRTALTPMPQSPVRSLRRSVRASTTKPVENSGSFSDISGHWAENGDRESGGVRLDFGLSGRHVPPRRPHHPR